MIRKKPISPPLPDGNEGRKSYSYARLLGELQFLTNLTRPDMMTSGMLLINYQLIPQKKKS
jgi:hypothetical protein